MKSGTVTVLAQPHSGDMSSALAVHERGLQDRAVVAYTSMNPQLSSQDIYPHLSHWSDVLRGAGERHALFAGSIGLEAAIGAPNNRTRKTFLSRARHHLGSVSLDGVQVPTEQQVRRSRLLGMTDIISTRSFRSAAYRTRQLQLLGQLVDARRAISDSPADGAKGNLSGFIMEQSISALMHDPSLGLAAVSSYPRQDGNEWLVDGRKYRWDVTVESDGSLVPAGQYRLQAKNTARDSDERDYHPDIIVVSGNHTFHDPARAEISPLATALVTGDTPQIADYQWALLTTMNDHGPAVAEVQYLAH